MTTRKLIVVTLASIVVLGLTAAIGGMIYIRNYSPYAPLLQATSSIGIAAGFDRQIKNQGEYVADSSAVVTEDQLARFVRVERQVEGAIGQGVMAVQSSAARLEQQHARDGRVTAQQALKEVATMAETFRTAKRAHVEALNMAGFSRTEYEWVRRQAYDAAGIELQQIDLEELRHIGGADDGVGIRVRQPTRSAASEARLRVQPYVADLRRWEPLAFFGM